MDEKNKHKRILLNKNPTGQVDYCEACDVIEIALGPLSVRLHAKDLAMFSELVRESEMRLAYYEAEKTSNQMCVAKLEGLH